MTIDNDDFPVQEEEMVKLDEDNLREPTPITPLQPAQSHDLEFKMSHVEVDIPEDSKFSWKKLFEFLGPGFFISVGYIDPGNWASDIEGGSRFGYKLIWVLLLSNWMALLLQTLAVRLGLVTQFDLAQCCGKEYPKFVRYSLWILCEIAIAATDVAEVLGTAIGLQLLFKIPLMIGVILTALDTLLFLVIQRYGIRKLEIIILLLLTIIASCFIVELFLSHPSAIGVLSGFIPSINNESLFVALAIIGATVMPHNFYLHSSVVQSRKFGRSSNQIRLACKYNLVDSAFALNMAFFVNMAILVVAAAVFHKQGYVVEELQDAHNLLEGLLNSKIAPIVFGLGLFCAGQSSTITGTMAGQIVMEGFIDFKLKPWIRRLITRSVAIIPAVIVIAIMGDEGTYKLLILSQVILSAQLPFAIVPLIRFTSDKVLMGEFVNNIWVNILSWLCALLIIALNLWLVGGYINDLFNDPSTIVYGALCIPVCLALIGLLLYITFRGLKLPCQRKYTLLERGSLNVDNATVQE